MADVETDLAESSIKVLIAEDDRTSRLILERLLVRWGHQVLTAENGDQALALLHKHQARLILSDWEMPGLTGIELCQHVRAGSPEHYVYIIIVTSRQQKEYAIAALAAGADDYLSKPYHPQELRARLAVGARLVRAQEALAHKTKELEDLNRYLATVATTDHLTEIGNRRSFEAAINRNHAHACRQGVPYGVLLFDIDCFKGYNDTYGHLAGDRALSLVARTVRDAVRAGDEVFRYGGEEFVVVTPFHTLETIVGMAERLRGCVERLDEVNSAAPSGKLTVSVGVAVLDPATDGTPEWTRVVARADEALYTAKERGRNCAVLWNPALRSMSPSSSDK